MDVLPPWRFDPAGRSWVRDARIAPDRARSTLTLATFNVWFGEHEFGARGTALLDLLRRSRADLIALQEVTPPFLRRLSDEDWVRRGFCLSDADGTTIGDYGTLLVSRLPVRGIEIHDLPTAMGRTLLLARIGLGSRSLCVGVVHLESLADPASYRRRQLVRIYEILEPEENAVLLGDFNFCSTWDENEQLDGRYCDLWPLAHPDRPGWTVDTETNRMRQALGKSKKNVRFDRILVRSAPGLLRLRSMDLLGTGPVSTEQPDLYPSDHFGLVATLDVAGPAAGP
jgi:endonuclease/exonuclease/phosphatase family metal-dependent hydrolase